MTHIRTRRNTSANWTADNPVLQLGEKGYETNTRKEKTGDGVTPWNTLPYDNVFTKADVGLGNVDNTSDLNKPISTATANALLLKAPLASPAFTGNPTAPTPAPGDNDQSLATTAFVQAALGMVGTPVGVVLPYAGSTPPTGWAFCDGSSLVRASYPGLFAAIGTSFGSVDGTHFNLPNMGGRVPLGVGVATGAPGATSHTLAQTGGEETHTMTAGELVGHTHAIDHDHASFNTASGGTHSHTLNRSPNEGDSGVNLNAAGTGAVSSSGGTAGGAHAHSIDVPAFTGPSGSTGAANPFNELPPYLGLNFIIRAV